MEIILLAPAYQLDIPYQTDNPHQVDAPYHFVMQNYDLSTERHIFFPSAYQTDKQIINLISIHLIKLIRPPYQVDKYPLSN